MANFQLSWTPNINGNTTAQRASYRQKSVGGAFTTTGFVPANDLPTSASFTEAQGLNANTVYEFKIENLCVVGGPTINNNGLVEQVSFECIVANTVLNPSTNSIDVVVTGLPVDITKVKFTLYDSTGTIVIQPSQEEVVVGGVVNYAFAGLNPATSYLVSIVPIIIVDGVEVDGEGQIGPCTTPVTTGSIPVCIAPVNLTVTPA